MLMAPTARSSDGLEYVKSPFWCKYSADLDKSCDKQRRVLARRVRDGVCIDIQRRILSESWLSVSNSVVAAASINFMLLEYLHLSLVMHVQAFSCKSTSPILNSAHLCAGVRIFKRTCRSCMSASQSSRPPTCSWRLCIC